MAIDQGDSFSVKPKIDNIDFRVHVEQMFATLKNLEKIDNWDTYIGHLCCLLFKVYSMALICGIELNKAFSIVHESNMSKLCTSEEEAKKTVENCKLNDPRYDSPNYRNPKIIGLYLMNQQVKFSNRLIIIQQILVKLI